jgi:hypothetical protein
MRLNCVDVAEIDGDVIGVEIDDVRRFVSQRRVTRFGDFSPIGGLVLTLQLVG